MTDTAHALGQLIATHFGGDATKALLALADYADIAVAWMDREVFAREFAEHGVTLTDELWQKVAGGLDDFDGYVGDADVNVHADYAQCVLRRLVTTNDRGEALDL